MQELNLNDPFLGLSPEEVERLLGGDESKGNEKAKNTGLGLTHANDLLNEPEETTSWLIDGLLPSGGFSIITAKPKVGKSTLAKQLALMVAKGVCFLNKKVAQGAVIYLAFEDKKAEIRKHLKAMQMTGDDPFYLYVGGAPLDAIKRITVDIAALKPVLLVIDTLFRLIRVRDGNAYNEVTSALDPLIRLARDSGTAILAVHHSKKGDSDIEDCLLGSTAIFGSVDTTILLRRYEGYRTIESRQRYGDDMEETILVFDKAAGTTDIGGAKADQDINSIQAEILDFLEKQTEPVDEKTILKGIIGTGSLKKKAIRGLYKNEEILRIGKGKKGNPFLYFDSPEKGGSPEKTETPNQHFDLKNDAKINSGSLVRSILAEPENNNNKTGCKPHGCKENSGSLVRGYEEHKKNMHEPAFLGEKPELNFDEKAEENITVHSLDNLEEVTI